MKKLLIYLIAAVSFLTSTAPIAAQTWVPVGDQWRSFTTTAAITIRVGYPDASGGKWVTSQITKLAPANFDLPDASALGSGTAEVDVQLGSTATVTVANSWYGGGDGCYSTATFTFTAAGAIPVATWPSNPCGTTTPPDTTTPVTTTPVTTTPVSTTPVTTPPVTTTPTTPTTIGPFSLSLPSLTNLIMSCATGLTQDTATGQNLFYIVCPSPPGTSAAK